LRTNREASVLLSRLFVSFFLRQREAFRARGLLFQTAVVTLSLLVASSVLVGAVSFALVSATRAVFHNPEAAPETASAEETVAADASTGQLAAAATTSSPGGRKVARTSGPLAKRPGEPRNSRGDTTE